VKANGKPIANTVKPAAPKAIAKAATKPAAKAALAGPQATPPAATASGATGSSSYAVQVGACTSTQCVDTYKKLIQPHVGTHPVQVMQQAAASGSAVQRVRVEPLTKDQAQSLKQTLEQADPRLKNAYVVKLADRS
jgi:cell division protein FtsN